MLVTARPAKVLSLCHGSGARVQLEIFPLLSLPPPPPPPRRRYLAWSFASASWLRSCWAGELSRTSAGCARAFYNALQTRHREGAVPGLRTCQSPCAARQLHQLLSTVSLHRRSHHAFRCYPLWKSASRTSHALREGALGGHRVIAPDGVCSWKHRCTNAKGRSAKELW